VRNALRKKFIVTLVILVIIMLFIAIYTQYYIYMDKIRYYESKYLENSNFTNISEYFNYTYRKVLLLNIIGYNTSYLVFKLDKALKLILSGNINEAYIVLNNINSEADKLLKYSDKYVLSIIVYKTIISALILSIPIIFYLLYPRTYLYLWYKFKKEWVVKK
jgi:hypothetical protein